MRRPFGAKAAAAALAIVVAAIAAAGCGPDPAAPAVPIEDLSRDLVRAERRAAGDPAASIRMDVAGPPDDRRLSVIATAPARITWSRRLPPHAQIATAVWLVAGEGATARVGIADDRTYEVVAQIALTAADGSGQQSGGLKPAPTPGFPGGLKPAPTARIGAAPTGAPTPPASTGWQPFVIDLRRYGGWQWSLFYRPSRTTWRLVFSTDATPGGTIAWDAPRIEARR